jgi:hypothetical protein
VTGTATAALTILDELARVSTATRKVPIAHTFQHAVLRLLAKGARCYLQTLMASLRA